MTQAPATPGPMQNPATWDAVAPGYTEEVVPHFSRYVDEALRLVVPGPGDRVLDVATGPGTLATLVAPRVASVVAVDFSPAMIEQVRTRAAGEGLGNVETAVMDAQALAFPDASFDAAYCMFAFMFFPDRARAFTELHRVLRPGGRALVATWAPIDRRPMMKIGFDALAEAVPGLPPIPKGDLQSPQQCVAEMSAAGFVDVEVHPFDASMFVESAEHYLRIMERSGAPFAMLRKKLGDEAWAQTMERLLVAVRARIPAQGAELAAEAILTHGVR